MTTRALVTCGVLASLTYVATDVVAGLRYPGYSFTDQAVSELFAIGAPTSRIVVPFFTLSSLLVAVFACGVWACAGDGRARRWLAAMLFGSALDSVVLWNLFPMHMRGVPPTLTDTMHLVFAANPFVLASVLFGIAAFRRSFRFYSVATMLVMLVAAVLAFSSAPAVVANQSTPGMGTTERLSQYTYQLWLAMLAVALLRRRSPAVSRQYGFKSADGEAAFRAAYDAALTAWPVPFEEIDVATRFGRTHVIVAGPDEAPPLVLLHGYMATSTMWSPNVADFTRRHRIYAVDVMGQSSKSVPDAPIRSAADYVAWLDDTLSALRLARVSLVGMSYGGWLACNYAAAAPERIDRLVMLSAGGFLPMVKQFSLRGMLMVLFPARSTVNSFMGWLGFTEDCAEPACVRDFLRLVYLGVTHFRMPPETARVMPTVFSDDALRAMHVPTLVLFGADERIYDPAAAIARARRLMPAVEADLIPDCRHDMCVTRHRLVDARVLEFLSRPNVPSTSAA